MTEMYCGRRFDADRIGSVSAGVAGNGDRVLLEDQGGSAFIGSTILSIIKYS